MPNKTTYRLLWIDDQIRDYSEYVRGLEDHGFTVDMADTVEAGNDLARNNKYDLILVDLRMQKGTSGFEFIRRYRSKTKAPICILSSYLHLPEFRKKIRRMKSQVATFDKDLPAPDSKAFTVFAEKLAHTIEKPPQVSPRAFEESYEGKLADPFSVTYKEYLLLPNSIKRQLQSAAEKQAKRTISKAFYDGKVWVFLCGSSTEIVMSAEESNEIPDNNVILNTAMETNRAPYLFSVPDSVDDLWSSSCAGSDQRRNYPTVTLGI